MVSSKQGVALTGRNTTGHRVLPPGELRCICADDADRWRQTPQPITSLAALLHYV